MCLMRKAGACVARCFPVEYDLRVRGATNAGSSRGLRGGSWNNNENNLRSSNRNNNDPTNENNNVGFRVARPLNAGPCGPIRWEWEKAPAAAPSRGPAAHPERRRKPSVQ